MGETEKRLMELGIVLPDSPAPLAHYVSVQWADNILYLSGSGPVSAGRPTITGRLGENVTVEQGYAAAREAGLNLISTLKRELGELDRVEQIVKLLGFVVSTHDFYAQPTVINGASDLFIEVFGTRGQHARSALGTNVLPFNIPVEVEIVVKVRQSPDE